jgi:hypothetical protein
MIKPFRLRLMVGISLLVLGGLLLLQSFGILPEGDWFWAIPFLVAGIGFLAVFMGQKHNWWAAIPGVVLLDLGVIILLGEFFPKVSDIYGGAIFLGGIALSFVLVYLIQKRFWWAIIPAGVLTTLAVVTLVDEWGIFDAGAVFFLGLALTFALLAILPTGSLRMKWPWYPAAGLLLVGAVISIGAESMLGLLWAVVLILVGGYLLLRSFRKG